MPMGVKHFTEPLSRAERQAMRDEDALWRANERRIAELEAAMQEIELRTRAYADDHEVWPLVSGVHDVARKALSK